MTTDLTTLWNHQPCAKPMSFLLYDRPNREGEYCEICRVEDRRWEFAELRKNSYPLDAEDLLALGRRAWPDEARAQ